MPLPIIKSGNNKNIFSPGRLAIQQLLDLKVTMFDLEMRFNNHCPWERVVDYHVTQTHPEHDMGVISVEIAISSRPTHFIKLNRLLHCQFRSSNPQMLWYHKLPTYDFGDVRSINFSQMCLSLHNQNPMGRFVTLDFFRTSFWMVKHGIPPCLIILPEMAPHVAFYHKLMASTSLPEINSIHTVYTSEGFEQYFLSGRLPLHILSNILAINADFMGDITVKLPILLRHVRPHLLAYSATRYFRGAKHDIPLVKGFHLCTVNRKSNKTVVSELFVKHSKDKLVRGRKCTMKNVATYKRRRLV